MAARDDGPTVVRDRGRPLVSGRTSLDPELESAGTARRLVRDALRQVGREAWIGTGDLLVSEVVTNAVLHAHTPIELWYGVLDDELCVEVRDFNPVLPIQRDYDVHATTGRGMGLVSALAGACGVHSLGDAGKVVWFCVSDEENELDPHSLFAAWNIDKLVLSAAASEGHGDVVLPAMPVTLWLSAREHHDAIVRELVLYLVEHPDPAVDVPGADRARTIVSSAVVAAVADARAAGKLEPAVPAGHPSPLPWVPKALDLRFSVPQNGAALFETLQDTLDVAERLAVAGELLIRPALPEIIAVRDWACEQVIAQLAGNHPSPWPGTDQERFEHEVHDRAAPAVPDWDATIVTEAATSVVAADDANRIIAISRSLAATVGWDPDELVGRRVVTLIPPALREAHVAGFSLHLSSGEAHVLGMPIELPVLCKDGTELKCRFLVEHAEVSAGRAVYLAWIDPLEVPADDEGGR